MLHGYPAEVYEFCVCTQEDDGTLNPPEGQGWWLISTDAAQDADSAVMLATWARPKAMREDPKKVP